jgi:hypothetical protein
MNRMNKPILIAVVVLLGVLVASCTKVGPEGKPGLDGIDGKDGAQTCGECHNMSEFLYSRIRQYENSAHAHGANTNRSDASCAKCHTSMGFRDFVNKLPATAIKNPTPINCRTCHPIHETYTTDDFALRTTDSVTLAVGNAVYNYGTSNLCANCHQARTIDPFPNLAGENIKITNPYYGPHQAPQANMFMAKGPIQIPGSMPYLNSAHTKMVDKGCVTCHMSPATGILAGGHQMNVGYQDAHGSSQYQYTGCYATDCHGTAAEITAMINPNREEIKLLLEQLNKKLMDKGLMNESGATPVPKTATPVEAAALVNYRFVEGDHSHGAHNYRFTKAVLTNSIEALNK